MVSHSMIWLVPGDTLAFSIRLLVSGVRSFGMLGPGLAGDMQPTRETAKRPWTRCGFRRKNLQPPPWTAGGLCTHPVPTAIYGHPLPTYGKIWPQIKDFLQVLVDRSG